MFSGERIQIQGTVQGVGFRPTVARLAQEMGLGGWVLNGPAGVTIHLAASTDQCTAFLDALRAKLPPIAKIESIQRTPLSLSPEETATFTIRPSQSGPLQTTIPPDAAVCQACLREISDPNDRRFGYAFASCTHCGPRYSIVQSMPYDRPRTTMTAFPLCPACRTEYEDPNDRRFHAQPIACPQCGPHLRFRVLSPTEADVPRKQPPAPPSSETTPPNEADVPQKQTPALPRSETTPPNEADAALSQQHLPFFRAFEAALTTDAEVLQAAHQLLASGGILAVKGLGGYHLCCDATQESAVLRLRQRKQRMFKPFALMVRDIAVASAFAQVEDAARSLLTHPAAPIVLLPAKPSTTISPLVAPYQRDIGIMLPTTPLHQLLIAPFDRPLVCTSGNRSHDPPCIHDDDALERLADIADAILSHDRPIAHQIDDSVAWIDQGTPRLIRRARGYAPQPLSLPPELAHAPPILALGGQFKATFCMLQDGKALLSPHLGDLDQYATFAAWKEGLHELTTLFSHQPAVIAVDEHPQYTATQHGHTLSQERSLPLHSIQHHHAHIAACMAEHQRPLTAPPLLGIALDGLGYGPNGQLWGGEFLLADYRSFQQVATFQSFPLLGGDQAARQPWRNLYAHLLTQQPLNAWQAQFGPIPPLRLLSHRPHGLLGLMLQRPDLSPPTSSCGRWFDAVAAALDIFPESIEEEAQAAIVLASLAASSPLLSDPFPTLYPFAILRNNHFSHITTSHATSSSAPSPQNPSPTPSSSPSQQALPAPTQPSHHFATAQPSQTQQAHPLAPTQQAENSAWILSPRPMWPALLHDIQQSRPQAEIAARFHLSLARAITELTRLLQIQHGFDTVALSGGVWQNPCLLQQVRHTLQQQGFSVLTHQHVPTHDGGISLGQAVIAAARLLSTH